MGAEKSGVGPIPKHLLKRHPRDTNFASRGTCFRSRGRTGTKCNIKICDIM